MPDPAPAPPKERTLQKRAGHQADLLTAGLGILTFAVCCLPASGWAQRTVVASVDDRQNFDRLLVVDCLLPGQVQLPQVAFRLAGANTFCAGTRI